MKESITKGILDGISDREVVELFEDEEFLRRPATESKEQKEDEEGGES